MSDRKLLNVQVVCNYEETKIVNEIGNGVLLQCVAELPSKYFEKKNTTKKKR